MHYAFQYLSAAAKLIHAYADDLPLAAYLKQYFAQHKKHGSKDRKRISELCYCYYRLGHALPELPPEEKIKLALFICSNDIKHWEALYNEHWLQQHTGSLEHRIAFAQSIYPTFTVNSIFPFTNHYSETIDATAFAASHLVQPRAFIRIRHGYEKKVEHELTRQELAFEKIGSHCIALPPGTKIEKLLSLNKEAVVQDYSSQRVGELLMEAQQHAAAGSDPWQIWDCCAASGGKAILAYDILKPAQLVVSDVRTSIIHNLRRRFGEAGIEQYEAFVTDAAKDKQLMQTHSFNLVICDVPCSGSGTWGRTPEQLYFFTELKLAAYNHLQRSILRNVALQMKTGTYLLYITCSVFKEENEEMVEMLQQQFAFKLIRQELLKGYDKQADTMFAALLVKDS